MIDIIIIHALPTIIRFPFSSTAGGYTKVWKSGDLALNSTEKLVAEAEICGGKLEAETSLYGMGHVDPDPWMIIKRVKRELFGKKESKVVDGED